MSASWGWIQTKPSQGTFCLALKNESSWNGKGTALALHISLGLYYAPQMCEGAVALWKDSRSTSMWAAMCRHPVVWTAMTSSPRLSWVSPSVVLSSLV